MSCPEKVCFKSVFGVLGYYVHLFMAKHWSVSVYTSNFTLIQDGEFDASIKYCNLFRLLKCIHLRWLIMSTEMIVVCLPLQVWCLFRVCFFLHVTLHCHVYILCTFVHQDWLLLEYVFIYFFNHTLFIVIVHMLGDFGPVDLFTTAIA